MRLPFMKIGTTQIAKGKHNQMKTLLYRSDFYSLYTGDDAALRYCLGDLAAEIPFA